MFKNIGSFGCVFTNGLFGRVYMKLNKFSVIKRAFGECTKPEMVDLSNLSMS